MIFEPQSEQELGEVTETGVSHMTNASASMLHTTSLTQPELLSLRQDDSRSLSQYLSRPVRLWTTKITAVRYDTILPVSTILQTPRVIDKIRGYAYMNATLHIKVLFNAPARSSGAMIVALQPWWTRDNGLGANNGEVNPTLTLCQLSQLPHIMVDFSEESGGEITMPIVAPTNGLNITSLEQIQSVYKLHLYTFVAPQIDAGDAGAKPYLNVLGWFTDVSLTGTTLTEIPEPQSEEYEIPVEKQPSTIKMALKSAARAVLDGAKGFATDIATSAIMAAAGLSKPIHLDPFTQHVLRTMGPLANFNGKDSIPRLSGDIKQEIVMHSDHLGFSNGDEMDLLSIMQRPAIVCFLGFPTDVDVDQTATVFPVSPTIAWTDTVTTTGDTAYTPSPMAFATLPFSRWRGVIKFKFKAVCSAFARGKFKFNHDVAAANNISAVYDTLEFQALNNVVWDISEHKEIIVTVPWTSNLPFKPVPLLHKPNYLGDSLSLAQDGYNGLLLLAPITSLIDPGMSTISIIVSVYAGDDFVVGDPRPVLANYTFAGINPLAPIPRSLDFSTKAEKANVKKEMIEYATSGVHLTDDGNINVANSYLETIHENRESTFMEPQSDITDIKTDGNIMTGDVHHTTLDVNIAGLDVSPQDSNEMLSVCIGEKYTNIRQIIKRYTHHSTRRVLASAWDGYYTWVVPDRPFMKGWQGTPASINIDPLGQPCTYARDTFLSYFTTAFLGYRGGFNQKYTVFAPNTNVTHSISATRANPGYLESDIRFANVNTANGSGSDILTFPDTRSGGMFAQTREATTLEFNTPHYARSKFLWAQDRTPQRVRSTLDGGYDYGWHNLAIYHQGSDVFRISRYVAAADDFSLHMFLYTPRMINASPTKYAPV
ncbi:hypothetical protein 2 [Sanxia picorna-like virus 3]|uniref:hypothetical protein 2 n=1 Tax=Sanxia picorna-like virus 3 TaxID=1923372 RepID=UPI00090BF918|nr:hypothetical protein 2 [Sanxia picorna-like virus 3]APG77481.1 hypothetical protein 2 [Sanxia picorna-like virus 3]